MVRNARQTAFTGLPLSGGQNTTGARMTYPLRPRSKSSLQYSRVSCEGRESLQSPRHRLFPAFSLHRVWSLRMLTPHRDLTNVQWEILDGLIPEPTSRRDGRGRPWKDRRAVLNGILWVLRTGAPWADVPDRYPPYQTCHRRFQQWVRSGVMRGVLEALALDLKARGALDIREAFIDGSFAPAKKGAPKSENQRSKVPHHTR